MFTEFNNLKFHVITFGCQMNKHDSERIAGLLESLGSVAVNSIEESDIVIFMTCCVREAADVRLYGQASSIKNIPMRKDSPLSNRIVAVGGCIGQRDKEKLIEKISNVNVVFGTHNIAQLPNLILNVINGQKSIVEVLDSAKNFPTELPTHIEKPWSAWLPITIGCNNFCTYCIVPYVRGREKSRTKEDIIKEATKYINDGVKEITLLGQNVNSYGRDLYGQPQFYDLLCKINSLGPKRLRFATSHPKDITDEVINAFGSLENLMPALHLPVQSGSNAILKKMNRRYTKEHYLGLIEKLRKANPDIAFSTDVIVGFPGETEQDFLETLDVVKRVKYHQVFTFIYSKREGTPAAKIVDNTPREVILDRFNRLLEAVKENAYELNQLELNKTVPVLFEGVSKKDSSKLVGKTPKNQTVHCIMPHGKVSDWQGSIHNVHIHEAKTWYLTGTLVE